ncbi:acetylornithine deacetylase [Luteococcus peritonei]|uniref:Acetylornithine deacetylase n=1 Tax=Luteococcus peritonei TaxID=88874 RepID=A0ABW4RY52_9ACTN
MNAPASLDWINRLISIDSTSRASNKPLIAALAEGFRDQGIEPVVFDAPDGRDKQGLVATVPAADGSTAGGVVISGHTDVVPVDGQQWSSDPFAPEVREGRLFGRGSSDMKSYIGVAMHILPQLVGAQLREPVHFAFSYDEELGCQGGDDIVEKIAELGLAPRAALVGEPTSMRVIRTHKSVNLFTITFTGVNAHSSLTAQGVNAIEYAAELVRYWRGVTDGWKADGPFEEGFPLTYSTGGVNQFTGGTAVNIVPGKAVVVLEFRAVAAVDPQQVLAGLQACCDDLRARMKQENQAADVELVVDAMVPALATGPDEYAVELAQKIGGIASDEKVTYGTEAGQFFAGGIPAVVCGPGDIAQAHTADEFVELSQIEACEAWFEALVRELEEGQR